jgi:hypothetical protein
MAEMRNACKMLVGKPEGNRPLGRHRRRLEDNVRMNIREIGWGGGGWLHLDHDNQWRAVVYVVMNLRAP